MKFVIVIHEGVFDEVESAVHYYEDKAENLGVKLIDDWQKILDYIHLNPEGFAKKHKTFRYLRLNRFPFLVVYYLKGNTIVITKFIHEKRSNKKKYGA